MEAAHSAVGVGKIILWSVLYTGGALDVRGIYAIIGEFTPIRIEASLKRCDEPIER